MQTNSGIELLAINFVLYAQEGVASVLVVACSVGTDDTKYEM